MELLKIRQWILFVLFLLTISHHVFGQDELVRAFSDSYLHERKGEYGKAIERLVKVYQPESYEINLRLGWLYFQSGKLSESEAYYNKAIALMPYSIESRLGLAYPLSAAAKWDELIVVYNKILEIDPQNSLINYRLGLIYYNRQNYDKADAYLERVINLYPFDYDIMLLHAWNKLALQKFREAKVLFTKVLLYNPSDSSALEGLKLIK